MFRHLILQAACASGLATLIGAAPVALFDGKSLGGWEVRKGEEKWWKVEDGMITGGSLTETVPFNTFLSSTKSYGNFDLSFKIRLVKGEGFMNSGMQIRSERADGDSEMIGYQVDAGPGFWGDIYDESRRNIAVAKAPGVPSKDWEWNEYRILCEGPRIRTWINGQPAADYTEQDSKIPLTGRLGLQAHGGGRFLVQLKDISVSEIAEEEGARTPETERTGFTLPPGYTVELVASEEQGVGKPITVTWDRHGRMWTMTALEYPVDANENEGAARELYKTGGRDSVLVFDEPNGAEPQTPWTFADKLAIPLGVLPTSDGVFVQHGTEIRRYRDSEGDRKADGFEVVLEGFGIQDSHLFPHQFERAPGGWIYLAQGAFNYSKVHRPGGSDPVEFNNCKLARFRPDGSAFEPLTGGPNNIWGLVISRSGETFIQEANDLGYPVAEFAPGTHYPTGSGNKLRDDAPILPPSTPAEPMGGTGLSGLALAEDADSPFAKNQGTGSVFYIANPITSKIQVVTMTRDAKGHPVYEKGADFMVSSDPWFRPISAHFGPDGCLYVVDWYNKIISHNEVPRTHPDRDKTHGRIWRIRHESQQPPPRVDLANLPENNLVDLLGGSNALLSMHAWQEIVDRKAVKLSETLVALVTDSNQPLARRCAALWAAEGLGAASPALLAKLAETTEPALRHEAVRIAGEASLPETDFLTVVGKLREEPDFRVRAAIANAVRSHHDPTPGIVALAAELGLAPMAGDSRDAYDRTFERYLARWSMSVHPEATREMLRTVELPVEARLLAERSFPDNEAAVGMVKLLPLLERPLTSDELSLLGSQLDQPAVQDSFGELLSQPERREGMLRTMTRLDAKIAAIPALAHAVEAASLEMLVAGPTEDRRHLVVQLARRFRIKALADTVNDWMSAPGRSNAELAEGLGALRETGGADVEKFRKFLDHPDDAVRREAVTGFASTEDPSVVPEFARRWAALSGTLRSLAVTGMTAGTAKADAFAKAINSGEFTGFDDTVVEKLISALGADHPSVATLLKSNEGLLEPVLQIGGNGPGRIAIHTTLKGPFTVEGWIKLDAGIDNQDALLGNTGGFDFNFHDSKLHIFGGDGNGDLFVANRPVKAGEWTHYAITRDSDNRFKVYQDGEPDTATGKTFAGDFTDLNIGESHRGQSSAASYDEIRVWDIARTADEIRRDLHTKMTDSPQGLVLRASGDAIHGTLEGNAKTSLTRDFPKLITPQEAATLDGKFARFRKMAAVPGDMEKGAQLVQASCMICHQIRGKGATIGPNLSGAGAMGTESLLRNILTPNAQLESGYYRHDVKLRDGTVVTGFLANESEGSITLRQIGADERVIPRAEMVSHDISRRSLMPEGIIDGFTEQQVADLFSYLKSLQ